MLLRHDKPISLLQMLRLLRADDVLWAQVKKDFQDIVLSARQDDFYRRHMYSNFGDAGAAVKSLVDEFQRQTTSSQNINTIEDMQVRATVSSCTSQGHTGWAMKLAAADCMHA